ncbi:MAG: uracil-DNA glycosylase [Deltaproteobacteria bacterium]|nr:uracil-DNA glycosylase [Deltaproteobacteria bacterium]MCL5276252.1 uracil-DNA glycosylase [Deltaproteobacteria bacterium]
MREHIESLVEYVRYLKELGYEGFPAPPVPTTTESGHVGLQGTRDLSLENIRLAVSDCSRCRLGETRTNTVPGEGCHSASLMFIGEAPGYDEDREGRPFVGRAGRLLTDIIGAMGMRREDVFIANVVKCRPPGNREPGEDEIRACSPYLFSQIDVIKPRIIVTLGRYSTATMLGLPPQMRISDMRGRFFHYKGIKVMPTFHPAYLLRNEKDKRLVWDDMKLVVHELGMQVPTRPVKGQGSGTG